MKRPTKKQRVEDRNCFFESADALLWDPHALVGQQLRVLWPDEHRYFPGEVRSYSPNTFQHEVLYDDGDEEFLILALEKIQLPSSAVRMLPPPTVMHLAALARHLHSLADQTLTKAALKSTVRGRRMLKDEDHAQVELLRHRANAAKAEEARLARHSQVEQQLLVQSGNKKLQRPAPLSQGVRSPSARALADLPSRQKTDGPGSGCKDAGGQAQAPRIISLGGHRLSSGAATSAAAHSVLRSPRMPSAAAALVTMMPIPNPTVAVLPLEPKTEGPASVEGRRLRNGRLVSGLGASSSGRNEISAAPGPNRADGTRSGRGAAARVSNAEEAACGTDQQVRTSTTQDGKGSAGADIAGGSSWERRPSLAVRPLRSGRLHDSGLATCAERSANPSHERHADRLGHGNAMSRGASGHATTSSPTMQQPSQPHARMLRSGKVVSMPASASPRPEKDLQGPIARTFVRFGAVAADTQQYAKRRILRSGIACSVDDKEAVAEAAVSKDKHVAVSPARCLRNGKVCGGDVAAGPAASPRSPGGYVPPKALRAKRFLATSASGQGNDADVGPSALTSRNGSRSSLGDAGPSAKHVLSAGSLTAGWQHRFRPRVLAGGDGTLPGTSRGLNARQGSHKELDDTVGVTSLPPMGNEQITQRASAAGGTVNGQKPARGRRSLACVETVPPGAPLEDKAVRPASAATAYRSPRSLQELPLQQRNAPEQSVPSPLRVYNRRGRRSLMFAETEPPGAPPDNTALRPASAAKACPSARGLQGLPFQQRDAPVPSMPSPLRVFSRRGGVSRRASEPAPATVGQGVAVHQAAADALCTTSGGGPYSGLQEAPACSTLHSGRVSLAAGADLGSLYLPRPWLTLRSRAGQASAGHCAGVVTGERLTDVRRLRDTDAPCVGATSAPDTCAAEQRRGEHMAGELQEAYAHFRQHCSSFKQYHEMQVTLWQTPQQLVGREVRILWPDEEAWFCGRITSYDISTGTHTVLYDDGDVEQLHLSAEEVRLQVVPSEAEQLVPQPPEGLMRESALLQAAADTLQSRVTIISSKCRPSNHSKGTAKRSDELAAVEQEEDVDELRAKAQRYITRALQLRALGFLMSQDAGSFPHAHTSHVTCHGHPEQPKQEHAAAKDDLRLQREAALSAECREVQVLQPGEPVWAQVRRATPWPAIVITREEAEREGLSMSRRGTMHGASQGVFVRFFGDFRVSCLPAVEPGNRILERGGVLPLLAGLDLGWHLHARSRGGGSSTAALGGLGSAHAQRFARAVFELRTYMQEGELPRGMIPPNYDEDDDEGDEEEAARGAEHDGTARHGAERAGSHSSHGAAVPCSSSAVPLPFTVSKKMRVLELGKVVWLSRWFHDEKYIYPVGYKAERLMSSGASRGKEVPHTMEIIADEDGVRPLFRISPEGGVPVTADTATRAMRALFEDDARASGRAFSRTGADLLGLSNCHVASLLRGLPGAERCENFANWLDQDKPDVPPLTSHEELQRQALYARALRLPTVVTAQPQARHGMCFECEVCGEDEESCEDLKLECDMCRCVVHMRCYGVASPPHGGMWLCDVCKLHAAGLPLDRVPPCELCPVIGGPMKRTDTPGGGYVHMLCAMWTPGVMFGDLTTLEPVEGIAKVVQSRSSLRCLVCKQPHGACIQCADTRCYAAMHPMCAREAGMAMCEQRSSAAGGTVAGQPAGAKAGRRQLSGRVMGKEALKVDIEGSGLLCPPGAVPEGPSSSGAGTEGDSEPDACDPEQENKQSLANTGPHPPAVTSANTLVVPCMSAGATETAANVSTAKGVTASRSAPTATAAIAAAVAAGTMQRRCGRGRGRPRALQEGVSLSHSSGVCLGDGISWVCFCPRHEELVLPLPEFRTCYPGSFAERRAEAAREALRASRQQVLVEPGNAIDSVEPSAVVGNSSEAMEMADEVPTGRTASFADWRSRGHRAPEAVGIAQGKRAFVRQLPYLVTGRLQQSQADVQCAVACAEAGASCAHPALEASAVCGSQGPGVAASHRSDPSGLPKELLKVAAAHGARSVAERYLAMRASVKRRLAVGKSAIHGWGAFAKVPHKRGDMLIEYAGELIRPVVSDVREKRVYDKLVGCGTYIFNLSEQQHIDATRAGNMAHLLNHSCEPNCYSRTITLYDASARILRDHVILVAKRDLKVWEELTYDYRFSSSVDLPCNCGAASCRLLVNWPEQHCADGDAVWDGQDALSAGDGYDE